MQFKRNGKWGTYHNNTEYRIVVIPKGSEEDHERHQWYPQNRINVSQFEPIKPTDIPYEALFETWIGLVERMIRGGE